MQALTHIYSCAIPLPYSNIDTDQIIPARYLKVTDKSGLAEGLFERWRYTAGGNPDPNFPLNHPGARDCSILITGDNFGSGSSREHAPWALVGWGMRAVISTSIADIFSSNALKNSLLPVVVSNSFHRKLLEVANAWFNSPSGAITSEEALARFGVTISVKEQTVTLPDSSYINFELDPFSKTCLMDGVDTLGYLIKHEPVIDAYEQSRQRVTSEVDSR